MRPGFTLSILLHVLIFGSAYVVFPMANTTMSEELIIVPIELVTVADTTNLAVSKPKEPEKVPEPEPEPDPTPEPDDPIPEDEAEISDEPDPFAEEEGNTKATPEEVEPVPEEIEPEEAEPEKKPEPKPTPKPTPKVIPPEEKKETTNSFLNSVLQTTEDKKKTREREFKSAPDLKNVENANENKRSAGDRSRDTATWSTLLRSKIETKCFRDPSDMANAKRLKVTYKITFNRDGNLMRAPRRVQPTIIPAGDQQLRVFDINASRAIEKCAPYSDIFPPELYDEWKDFTLNFGSE